MTPSPVSRAALMELLAFIQKDRAYANVDLMSMAHRMSEPRLANHMLAAAIVLPTYRKTVLYHLAAKIVGEAA